MEFSTRLRAIRKGRNWAKGGGADDYRKKGSQPKFWWRKSWILKWNRRQRKLASLQNTMKKAAGSLKDVMSKFDISEEDVKKAVEENDNIS